jgi:hypothetical protein
VKPNICGTNYFVENRQVFLLELFCWEQTGIFIRNIIFGNI